MLGRRRARGAGAFAPLIAAANAACRRAARATLLRVLEPAAGRGPGAARAHRVNPASDCAARRGERKAPILVRIAAASFKAPILVRIAAASFNSRSDKSLRYKSLNVAPKLKREKLWKPAL